MSKSQESWVRYYVCSIKVEFEGQQMKQCSVKCLKDPQKSSNYFGMVACEVQNQGRMEITPKKFSNLHETLECVLMCCMKKKRILDMIQIFKILIEKC
jgi:hypothetical protein